MQTYDLFMLLVLGAATLFGFWKGFAWQIASVASLVVSYFAALRFAPELAPRFGDTAPWNKFVAMLVIYVATSAVIWLAFRLVSGVIDRVKLKEFDHQLGAMLGLAKGALWCVAITFFAVTLLPPTQKEKIVASRAGRYIVMGLGKAEAVVPPEIHQVIEPYLNRIGERLDPSYQQPVLPFGTLPQQLPLQDLSPNWQQGEAPQAGAMRQNFSQPEFGGPQPAAFPNEPRPFQPPYTANQPGQTNGF